MQEHRIFNTYFTRNFGQYFVIKVYTPSKILVMDHYTAGIAIYVMQPIYFYFQIGL
jgi:hypothetical protein